jgi:hypothetical protein
MEDLFRQTFPYSTLRTTKDKPTMRNRAMAVSTAASVQRWPIFLLFPLVLTLLVGSAFSKFSARLARFSDLNAGTL